MKARVGILLAVLIAGNALADAPSLRRAIEDLAATFPDKYTRAPEFLQRLDSVKTKAEFSALQREALFANPLLDFDRVLAVKRNAGNLGLPANYLSNSSLPKTGYDNSVIEFSIHGKTPDRTVFTPPGKQFVGDLCLHFDGTRFLFSMPNTKDWQVHEINVDGTGLRQVTPDIGVGNYDACYLPDGDILFTSALCMTSVPCVGGGAHVANLCRLFTATGKVRQLCFDQEHNWSPRIMPNGTVLYQRWEYTDTPHSNTRLLMTMNPDGTNQREFYGSNSYWPSAFFYATPIPGTASQVIGISSGHHGDARQGELYVLDPAKSRREDHGVVRQIPSHPTTPSGKGKIYDHMLNVWPRFLHPFPLSEKYFLVACRPSPKDNWGIYLVDVFDNFVLLKETPGYAMFEPVALAKRPVPPVIPDKVNDDRKDAVVYIADIYAGGGLEGIPRGTVKALRLFTYIYSYHGVGGLLGVVGMDGPWDVRRMLGTVPVNPDGSAKFRVPANTPISIQPLDDKGQALALMRSWMTARPGEQLSCIGCHEDPSMTPPAQDSIAFSQEAPAELKPWRTINTGFAFEHEVQPVLDRHCVSCHDGTKTKPDLRGDIPLKGWHSDFAGHGGYGGRFSTSYANLFPFVRNNGIEGDYHLLAPMEFHFSATELGQMLRKGHHGIQLGSDDFTRLVTWADLNRPYHGSWSTIVGSGIAKAGVLRAASQEKFANRTDPYDEAAPPPIPEDTKPIAPAPEPPIQNPGNLPNWTFKPTGQSEITLDLGDGQTITLVHIPAGEFVMGSTTGHRDEQPVSVVKIAKSFWMAKFETSNAQFRRFNPGHDSRVMDALAYQFGQRPWSLNEPTQPVCRISFREAQTFCDWLAQKTGKRIALPTEAQWEWACRAGTATEYSFGDKDADYTSFANLGDRSLKKFCSDTAAAGYHGIRQIPNPGPFDDWIPKDDKHDDGHQLSAPVGSYRPNPFGLFDMHGNVSEWTRSPYRPYPYRDEDDTEADRVVRGGSWYDRPFHCTSSYRVAYRPYQKVFNVGFRIICEEEDASTTEHRFACTDYSQGKVFIVAADGKVEWEYPAKNCNDLWVLPNGNLLFNTGHGVQEVTREKKVVFDYQSKSEIYACQRLANGNTFVGECNAGRLLEVAPDGKIVKEVRLLPEGKDGGHAYMRNARRLANGNYLVAHYSDQVVREYDADGKSVRDIPATGGPHSCLRLANGNTLIACGDRTGGHRVFEVDPAGRTVWEVKEAELPGNQLYFMAGLQRLPNGNTVISNWLGHGQFGKAPHLIEVTPDKKMVWTFADHKTMKTISSVQLLDVPGDVTKGEIAH